MKKKKRLTFREMQITGCVAACLSNAEIGALLRLSRCTIKWHMENIFRKLKVGSRTELAIYWLTGRFAETGPCPKPAR